MKKVIVIGAGPAGISASYMLSKNNVKVEIFEASPYVGGMSRSFNLWGQTVDLGPHRFFSKEPKVNQFFNEVLKDDYTNVSRLTRIYYNKRFFDYPLKLFNVFKNLSISTIVSVLYYYIKQQIIPIKNPRSFEDWVTNRFGKKLYGIFFKNYTEKLWGIPGSKIDADWAAQRIKGLSLIEAVINSIRGNKNNKHKTLVDQFKYPNGGTGSLYNKALEHIESHGGVIYMEQPISKLIINNNVCKGVVTKDGEEHYADYVISSMPITKLIKGIDITPKDILDTAKKLYFRNTILVYLEINDEHLFDDNWIYIHAPNVKHGRITNFRNWAPSLNKDKKSTILCMEFWAFDNDDIWKAEDEYLASIAEQELKEIKLISADEKIENVQVKRVPKCYPVYETGYKEHLQIIENYLNSIDNLIPIGRYGAFKYNNQDHSILMGILAGENICYNSNINLWDINTDTDYQEDGEVKDVLIQ
ncbi:FAD-dependent oxidoreductase [Winogradskyella sp.]|uniref:FAD-dependent oxidoreductase n=1 Tax=Winogradskyella sp. TaxID=1883156 RepID=UPI0026255AD4|nr:FAD-dependent oxidoreductase [Winogradskyella sp.]